MPSDRIEDFAGLLLRNRLAVSASAILAKTGLWETTSAEVAENPTFREVR